ncbi:glycoprotein-N-acetylgalactosamine 3-beta-galactosyltransferase [Microdochium nivale]|nr:glycoprotein-N-acetylgalactosamine 3-beta-galactosyltransferase [Microdochium nivale]
MMLTPPSRTSASRLPLRIAVFIFAVFTLHQVYYFHDRWSFSGANFLPRLGRDATEIPCSALRGLDDILVVIKTGANEAPIKIPRHFDTTLRCVKHHVIYSDLAEDINGHSVLNVLDEVDPAIVAQHPDFEYYHRLQQHGRGGFSPDEKAQWAAAQNTQGGRDSPGWRLDKWKFLPMADKALRHHPDAKWYFFIEADTFVVWETVLAWLAQIDSSKPYYLGQQMMIGDVVFAYGGSGFAISKPALQKVIDHRNADLKHYDEFTGKHWAGDCILGKALNDAGVPLTWAFPTLQSEAPPNLDFASLFGGSARKPWCYFAGTYHHVTLDEAVELERFEREWRKRNARPFRHGDLFKYTIRPNLEAAREGWDNVSDKTDDGAKTLESCRAACTGAPGCLQWSFVEDKCKTATSIRLGYVSKKLQANSAPITAISGWMLDRIDTFIAAMDLSCATEKTWALP